MKNSIIHTTLILCLLQCYALIGQTQMQVVTRQIEKSWDYVATTEVNIEGEKAEIRVDTWNSNKVKMVVEIISQHPDRSVAEAGIDAMIFKDEKHSENLYFRNYLNKNKPTEASVSVVYHFTLPADCPVYLKNNFGLTYVNDLSNKLTINSEFSKIFLENLSGSIGVTTRFGDVDGKVIDGDVMVNSRRSDLTFREIKGNWNITAQYGIIKLFELPYPTAGLFSLTIDAEKSDVYFFDPQPTQYGYNLVAHYGNISAPQDLKFNYIENTNELKKAIFTGKVGKKNAINVKISFGDIVIRNP